MIHQTIIKRKMKELIEALEYATGVHLVEYDKETKEWTIHYRDDDSYPDVVNTEDLIEFLYNA